MFWYIHVNIFSKFCLFRNVQLLFDELADWFFDQVPPNSFHNCCTRNVVHLIIFFHGKHRDFQDIGVFFMKSPMKLGVVLLPAISRTSDIRPRTSRWSSALLWQNSSVLIIQRTWGRWPFFLGYSSNLWVGEHYEYIVRIVKEWEQQNHPFQQFSIHSQLEVT